MEITQESLHELFDYRDGYLYWKVRPSNRVKVGDKACTLRRDGYSHIMIKGVRYLNHRLIFLMHKGYLPDYLDHINGIRSDNHIENLRESSSSENSSNRCMRNDNTSGHKGVSWSNHHNKWRVQVNVHGKAVFRKCYEDLELAILVAEEARLKYHGEFANHGNKNEAST